MRHDASSNESRGSDDKGADGAFTTEGGYVAREYEARRTDTAPSTRARLMSEFSITYDGRRYRYGNCRYDRLAEAIACARLTRSKRAL